MRPARSARGNRGAACSPLLVQGGGACSPSFLTDRDEKDAVIQDLQRQLDLERETNKIVELGCKVQAVSAEQRDSKNLGKVSALERRLDDRAVGDAPEAAEQMARVRGLHGQLLSDIDGVRGRTAKVLVEQQDELMRAFRLKLDEYAHEQAMLKDADGGPDKRLRMQHRQAEAHLREIKGLAEFFKAKNQELEVENLALKERLRTEPDETQKMVMDLVMVRREVVRLRARCEGGEAVALAARPSSARDGQGPRARHQPAAAAPRQASGAAAGHAQHRAASSAAAVASLRRTLEDEERLSKTLERQVAQHAASRSELEELLRRCLDSVKADILRMRGGDAVADENQLEGAQPPRRPRLSLHELTAQDRERVIGLLLAQPQAAQLLYGAAVGGASGCAVGGGWSGTGATAGASATPAGGAADG